MRVAIFGDIGGHATAFGDELVALGADPGAGRLPEDLAVVQVGDLVHRGPDGDGVISLVATFLDRHPDRWIQLVGNHEAHYLGGPGFVHGGPELSPASVETLRGWWTGGAARPAVAVGGTELGDLLVTHAGVTATTWIRLGAPDTAARAAAALERLRRAEPDALFRPGVMLGGTGADLLAGPCWAHPGLEVYPSWEAYAQVDGARVPGFGQVHGHATSYRFDRRTFDAAVPASARATAVVDQEQRHVQLTAGGMRFVEVDCQLGRAGRVRPRPLVVTGTID